jgi:putative flippase GtrA
LATTTIKPNKAVAVAVVAACIVNFVLNALEKPLLTPHPH